MGKEGLAGRREVSQPLHHRPKGNNFGREDASNLRVGEALKADGFLDHFGGDDEFGELDFEVADGFAFGCGGGIE